MNGSSSGSRSLRMFVGIGSKEHDLDFDDAMSLAEVQGLFSIYRWKKAIKIQ